MTGQLVYLSGPSGSGKSTVLRNLERHLVGATFIPEPHPTGLLQDLVVGSRPEAGLLLQQAFIRRKAGMISASRGDPIVVDRSLSEDRAVFLELHRDLQNISQVEFDGLVVECRTLEAQIPSPTLCICLTGSESILRERMLADERPEWLIENLERQLQLYSAWRSACRWFVYDIDTSRTQPQSVAQTVAHLIDKLPSIGDELSI